MIVFDEEFNQIKQVISRLMIDANAKMVFLVDRNGQQIAAHGDTADLARGGYLLRFGGDVHRRIHRQGDNRFQGPTPFQSLTDGYCDRPTGQAGHFPY